MIILLKCKAYRYKHLKSVLKRIRATTEDERYAFRIKTLCLLLDHNKIDPSPSHFLIIKNTYLYSDPSS
jgi:hypothetical protein